MCCHFQSQSKTRFRSTQWILLPFFPPEIINITITLKGRQGWHPSEGRQEGCDQSRPRVSGREDRAGRSSTAQTEGGHLPGDLHCGHRVRCVCAGQTRLPLDSPPDAALPGRARWWTLPFGTPPSHPTPSQSPQRLMWPPDSSPSRVI